MIPAPIATLSEGEKAEVDTFLQYLGTVVTLKMSSEVPQDEWAFTKATQRLDPSVPGMASTIHLLTEFVVDVGVNPIIDLQVNWLTMAITLVHEVTHALHIVSQTGLRLWNILIRRLRNPWQDLAGFLIYSSW
jgi:hypothetical protein